MPRAGRICSTPGCPAVLTTSGKCDDCRNASNKARGNFRQRGYGAGHDRFRAAVLALDPRCAICGQADSVVADHYPRSRRELVAQGLNPDDPAYGRGLCTPCDRVQTAQRQGGFHVR